MCLKSYLLLFFTIMTCNCLAQVTWSAEAGVNYSNITAKDRDGSKANTSSVPGVYFGLGMSIVLSDQISLQPSIVYAKRGFKQPGTSHIGWGNDFEAKVSYVELPVDILFSHRIGPGKFLLAAGPYIGYGTGGKWTTSTGVLIGDIMIGEKGDITFQNDDSYSKDMNTYTYAKPWDYGAHFRIGYEILNRYSLSFQIQQGIADLQPRWSDYKPESSVRNRSMGITLSYSF